MNFHWSPLAGTAVLKMPSRNGPWSVAERLSNPSAASGGGARSKRIALASVNMATRLVSTTIFRFERMLEATRFAIITSPNKSDKRPTAASITSSAHAYESVAQFSGNCVENVDGSKVPGAHPVLSSKRVGFELRVGHRDKYAAALGSNFSGDFVVGVAVDGDAVD